MDYTIKEIEQVPRLVVSVAPLRYDAERLSIQRCAEIIPTCQVRVRGWFFPHISRESIVSGERNRYIMHETEVQGIIRHLEQWRMYRSGQFVFRMMLWEVPNAGAQEKMRENADGSNYNHWDFDRLKGFVGFVGVIYSVSEAFTFASRLAQAVPYDTPADISVSLRGLKNWALGSTDWAVHLDEAYIARVDALEHQVVAPLDELVADPLGKAADAITSLFQQFGWMDPSRTMIGNWQRQIFK
ncbi:MAG: hypothetical protein ACYDB1_10270 [Acidiferrobacteraceae bacterium]